jgi:TRAP-type C4-dicarboxylate transport system, small permease component
VLRAILDRIYLYAGYVSALFLVGIALSIIAQIGGRMMGKTIEATEVAGLCLAASTFFGLAHTFRNGAHVRIRLLINRLPWNSRRPIEILNCLLASGAVCFLAWNMILFALQSFEFNDISPGLLAIPFWIPQAGVAAGIALFAIAIIDELLWIALGGQPRTDAAEDSGLDKPAA